MPSTRREFLGKAALVAAGTSLHIPWQCRATPEPRPEDERLFAPNVTLDDFNAALIHRTAPARERIARTAAFLNRSYPVLRDQTVAAAEEAMRGQLLLPGSSSLSAAGVPPDWTTPRYGDEEYLWSLNRMVHWKTLLHAHALTGDERYAGKVVAELDDWIERAPPPSFRHADGSPNPEAVSNFGPPPWRSLEVGIRMFDSWPLLTEHLAGTAHLPTERLGRLAASVTRHAEALSLLCPLVWPAADHNHYFMEMLGLLSVAVGYPELAGAATWTDQAIRELQRCVRNQFTAGGSHVEACPSYHNVCVILLARFFVLTQSARIDLPAEFHHLITAAAEHSLHSTRPTGVTVPWGDSAASESEVDAVLWVAKATGDTGGLRQLGALLGVSRLQNLCIGAAWDLEDPAAVFATMALPPVPRSCIRFDRANDQAMLRTGWTRDALSVFFSCHSPLHPGSGHQHIDLGGFDLTALGQALVVDPGPFTYREDADRRLFKSSAYHSVLTVDGREPFDYISRWRYTPQKEGRIGRVIETPGLVRVESFHRNYEPILCRRTFALLEDRFVVVMDTVEGLPADSTVQIYFHLDSIHVELSGTGQAMAAAKPVGLVVASSGGLDAERLPGRVSERFDVSRPSTRLRFSDHGGAARRCYAHVLVPFRSPTAVPVVEGLRIAPDLRSCTFSLEGREYQVEA